MRPTISLLMLPTAGESSLRFSVPSPARRPEFSRAFTRNNTLHKSPKILEPFRTPTDALSVGGQFCHRFRHP